MLPRRILTYFNRRNLVNLVALVIIMYMAVAIIQVIGKNFSLQREVDSLRRDIEALKNENIELEYDVAYYQTEAFADREARDKLGLQAPGEKVVIFPDKIPPLLASEKAAEPDKPAVQQALSNLQQWLYFLFKIEPN